MAYQVKDAIEWHDDALQRDQDNRTDFELNEEYLAGKQWPEQEAKARGDNAVVVNKLDTPVVLICNQVASAMPGPQVSRRDAEDTENTAEIYEGILRDIQYVSRATDRYLRQLDYAVGGNIGFLRLLLAYVSPNSMDRELRIGDVADPQMCVLDPDAREPDKSDMRRFMVRQQISFDEYQQRFGRDAHEAHGGFAGSSSDVGRWYELPEETLWIAEDWTLEHDREKLLRVNGQDVWEKDEARLQLLALQAGGYLHVERECWKQVPRVVQRIINGSEVLEKNEWPGPTIPFFPIITQERTSKGRQCRKSFITDARSSQRIYNYVNSQQLLDFKTLPSSKFLVGRSAISGLEDQYRHPNDPDVTVLVYNEYDATGRQLAPPLFQRYQMDIQNYSVMLNQTEADIQQLTHTPPPALGLQQSASESGKKVQSLQQQAGLMNSHAGLALQRTVQALYRAAIEVIPLVYSRDQALHIVGADDKSKVVWVNQHLRPDAERWKDPRTGQVKLHNLSLGRYDVVADTGPNYQTRQQETRVQIKETMQLVPQAVALAPDLCIRLQDLGPEAEPLIERVTPEQYKEQSKRTTPEDEHQRVVQLDQAAQALQAEVQRLTQEIETEKVKQGVQIEIAKINSQTTLEAKRMDIEGELAVEQVRMEGKVALEQLNARIDAMGKQMEWIKEERLQRHEHAHEAGMAAFEHSKAREREKGTKPNGSLEPL